MVDGFWQERQLWLVSMHDGVLNNELLFMKRILLNLLLSIIATCLIMELFSLGWYGITQNSFFYSSDRPVPTEVDSSEPESLIKGSLHPFFGYFNGRGNNHNFYSPRNYPYVRENENQYIVGVFGGSVALHFAHAGQESFIQRLQEDSRFSDKEVVILVFAAGGYKQPQQLMILNYYLATGQDLDLVINLDGFNEVALSNRNREQGIDPAMPSVDHMLPVLNTIDQNSLTAPRLALLYEITTQKQMLGSLAEFQQQTPFATGYFVADQLYKIVGSRHQETVLDFQNEESGELTETLVSLYTAESVEVQEDGFSGEAKLWANASIMMKTLLDNQNISYLHVLQPNQYFSNKVLTESEKAMAISPDHPYGRVIGQGYPELLKNAGLIEQQGVAFYNAITIFDNVTETIYSDDCCHFNQAGNDLFASLVAEAVLESLQE